MKPGTPEFDNYVRLALKYKQLKEAPKTDKSILRRDSSGRRTLYISSTILRHFFHKNKEKTICPQNTHYTKILGNKTPPTSAMLAGLYFESLCIGSTADGTTVTDLPRHKKTGKKLTTQLVVEEQAMRFPTLCQQAGIVILKEDIKRKNDTLKKNVQVTKVVQWEDKELAKKFPDVDVYISLCADIVSPVQTKTRNYDVAVIDLKWTANLMSEFGDYCWGTPQYMDHIQGYLYAYLLDIPFVYWVFDAKGLNKFIPVNTDVTNRDPVIANEARIRRAEMFETIRNVVTKILIYEDIEGWNPDPRYEICVQCPLMECPVRNSEQVV